ncbi:hypothetical protein HY480_05125 [Candidatus Uhrbacteria bacterium]|nr:hypothetical protein [Candidatus Uhrbacteria bacterium]
MERKTVRGRFAEFLTECRFGWQVLTRDDRSFLIFMMAVGAISSIIAAALGATGVLEWTVGVFLLTVAIAITDAWRTGHRALRQYTATQRPNQ